MASLKLLVVEDDIASLELMTEVFKTLEAEVRPISDSESAATIVAQEKFDGIFLDLEMPKLNGFELAQKIRQGSWNRLTPIIVVTGRSDRDTMQRAFAIGATFFLQKPVDRQKLNNLLRTVRGTLLENRRKAARVSIQTEVSCTVGSRTLRGRTWNLSQGGMQLEVEGVQPGETVRVSFRLPSSNVVIDASATVVWAKNDRQGVLFSRVGPQQQEEIRQFIVRAERP
jgi:CheY-like chemotaxis protein